MPFPAPPKVSWSTPARWLSPLPLAACCTLADLFWFLQALGAAPRHAGSNVAMVSLVVWVVLHLPAALLVGGLVAAAGSLTGSVQALPLWSIVVLGALGFSQTFAAVYLLSAWRRRTR